MSEYVSSGLRRQVRNRANGRCEYCLIHEEDCFLPHEPDHIIAVKHGGETREENLAWTCFVCNRAKGSDIASIDGDSGDIVRLFSPRRDGWNENSEVAPDGQIRALTSIARATINLLRINRAEQVELRFTLLKTGLFPRS